MKETGEGSPPLANETMNCFAAKIEQLQAEVERLSFERDEALRILGEKIEENEQVIDIHNEQAVCAEKFATTMAENVLFRDALKSVATRRNYCLEDYCLEDDEYGETWFRYVPLDGTFAPYIVAETALNATIETAKIQAILDAATRFAHSGAEDMPTNGLKLINAVSKQMEEPFNNKQLIHELFDSPHTHELINHSNPED